MTRCRLYGVDTSCEAMPGCVPAFVFLGHEEVQVPRWYVPVTIVEYGREAVVDAPTKRDAEQMVRRGCWEELMDASAFDIRRGPGKITLVDEPSSRRA